ncbi:hypothetical protein [Chroococcidiopsis sp [FACHB-1243]]|nr:hypothetical protein [Chroococcidiopsis sp. [FACHB-1243]]
MAPGLVELDTAQQRSVSGGFSFLFGRCCWFENGSWWVTAG